MFFCEFWPFCPGEKPCNFKKTSKNFQFVYSVIGISTLLQRYAIFRCYKDLGCNFLILKENRSYFIQYVGVFVLMPYIFDYLKE